MKNLRTLVVFLGLFIIASGSAWADAKSDKKREDVISYHFRYGIGAVSISDIEASMRPIKQETLKMEEHARFGLKKEFGEFTKAVHRFDAQVKAHRAALLKECLAKTPKHIHDLCKRDLAK